MYSTSDSYNPPKIHPMNMDDSDQINTNTWHSRPGEITMDSAEMQRNATISPPKAVIHRIGMTRRRAQHSSPVSRSYDPELSMSPSSTAKLATLPLANVDLSREQLMQAINFDELKDNGTVHSPQQVDELPRTDDDAVIEQDIASDLMEQQQTREQAKLLDRFRELRNWQLQQQQLLMLQQQEQLSALREEQHRVQLMISKQRNQHWGGGNTVARTTDAPSGWITPQKARMDMHTSAHAGHDLTNKNGSQQAPVHVLPTRDIPDVTSECPDEERYTNPDLFSNPGSQTDSQDETHPPHEYTSEYSDLSSSEIMDDDLPALEKQQRTRDQVLSRLRSKGIDLETDEGIGTQSYQSSPRYAELSNHDGDDDKHSEAYLDDTYHSDQAEDFVELHHPEYPNSKSSANTLSRDPHMTSDPVNAVAVSNIDEDLDFTPDEKPIKSAGQKTFEELIEEQLRVEADQNVHNTAAESPNAAAANTKKTFLRKGQGIIRFSVPPKRNASKPNKQSGSRSTEPMSRASHSNNVKTVTSAWSRANAVTREAPTRQERKGTSKQISSVSTNTALSKDNKPSPNPVLEKLKLKSVPRAPNKTQQNGPSNDCAMNGAPNLQTAVPSGREIGSQQQAKSTAPKSFASRTKPSRSEPDKKTIVQKQSVLKDNSQAVKADDSDGSSKHVTVISDTSNKQEAEEEDEQVDNDTDVSFICKIKEAEKHSMLEKEDLDEFEMLEEFADNASFSSNSSLVVRVLQKDRVRMRQAPAAPTSLSAQLRAILYGQPSTEPANFRQLPGANGDHEDITDSTLVDDESDTSSMSSRDSSMSSDSESESDSELSTGLKKLRKNNNVHKPDKVQSSYHRPREKMMAEKSVLNYDSAINSTRANTDMLCSALSQSDSNHRPGSPMLSPNKNYEQVVISPEITPNPKSPIKRKIAGREDKSPVSHVKIQSSLLDRISALPGAMSDTGEMCDDYQVKGESQHRKEFPRKSKLNLEDISDTESETLSYSESDTCDELNIVSGKSSVSNPISKSLSYEESSESRQTRSDIHFDDDEEWADTTLKSNSPANNEHVHSESKSGISPAPTSKLMMKLFPKLKPKTPPPPAPHQAESDPTTAATSADMVQSKLVRQKLTELECEIEKFRAENALLEKLRKEREEGVAKLKKEIADFEKEKAEELHRLHEFKKEEMRKLKHEKKVFDQYQKSARAGPDKQERQEIEMLKTQLSELQEELHRKEGRWSSSTSRLKHRIDELEEENKELKEEVSLMERRRLEWMHKEQAGKMNGVISRQSLTMAPLHEAVSPDKHDTGLHVKAPVSSKQAAPKKSKSNPKINTSNSLKELPSKPAKAASGKSLSSRSAHSHTSPSKPSNQTAGQQQAIGNGLRTSLNEDVPRKELSAPPATQSAELDVSCEGQPASTAVRSRKTTSAMSSVDRSFFDKRGTDYEETQHADGKVERVYRSGAREILFSNGTRKEISSDGQSIIVSFFNGDVKQIMPDQSVVYYYAEAQTTHTTYPDGLEVLQFPNQQTEKHYPDGTKEIMFPDQTIKYLFSSGVEESVFADGTVIRVEKNSDKTITFPNGQREIHTEQFKKREYPDGTVKTVFPDGRQETRYSNGRIRVKDKDGNILMDRKC